MERMKTDQEFAQKITACQDAKERLSFAQKSGFDFTAEEIGKIKQRTK
jgi:predicted ribosomally synthesized peptide with nif11-like leader